jgi:hypothetical protein
MRKLLNLFVALSCLLTFTFILCLHAMAQKPSVGVDHFSGALSVSAPLHSFQLGSMSVPIVLSYNGGGIKVKDVEGNAGMGWSLTIGGEISRQVRGLPDDVKKDESSNARLGWIHNTNGTKINSFTIYNDNSAGTTTDEDTDLAYIGSNFSDNSDTEPDLFYVNAPGLNCKLVFDNDLNIRTIPYQDVKVSYILETSVPSGYSEYGRIKSFTITTNQGLTYFFDKKVITRKRTSSSTPSTLQYFKHEYELYENTIEYASSWKLSTMRDMAGNEIYFYYSDKPLTFSSDNVEMTKGTSSTPLSTLTTHFTTWQVALFNVQSSAFDLGLYFTYVPAQTSGVSLISTITGPGKKIQFNYTTAETLANSGQYKTFLHSYDTEVKGQTQTFEYYGLDNYISLPDSVSKEIDQWGYYNASGASSLRPNVYINTSGSGYERFRTMSPESNTNFVYTISNGSRAVNPATIANGSLKAVHYDDGGSTTITYEPNSYYDPTASAVFAGGGIRVKKVTDDDGMDTLRNMVRNFSYINPSTSASSGKAIAVPVLAFGTPYSSSGTTEQQWQGSVVQLEENFSQENTSIAYTHVKESTPGAGSTLYEFTLPATNWDSSSSPDWAPTVVNIARIGSVSAGYLINETNTYPFIPNTNFDFERGLLKKVIQFNDNGDKVTESVYTYARSNSPLVINAFKMDYNTANLLAYAKYSIYSSVSNLSTQVTNTVYDAPSTTQYNQTITDYEYASSAHKLPTKVTQTNSDGSISRSLTKYVKDYNVSTHADDMTTAIYNLQQLGANMPVETYNQIERSSVNKTIGASLVMLKPWSFPSWTTNNLPVQTLGYLNAAGVTDFAVSTVTSGSFVKDSRYLVKGNMQAYNHYGHLLTSDDNNKNVQTVLTGLLVGSPVAKFGNAAVQEIAFNDFDNWETDQRFETHNSVVGDTIGRANTYALNITSSNYFTTAITQSVARKAYIFSIWIKSGGSGTITLSLTNASSSTYTYNINYANTSGKWKFYQLKVPVTNMSTTFNARFESSTSISIDDVLFYPADASAAIVTYSPKNLRLTAQTGANGIAQYMEYDKYNRLKHILDQDLNIVLKKSYVKAKDQEIFNALTMVYTTSPSLKAGQEAFFNISSPIYGDTENTISVSWDFGDGSTTTTTGIAYHTYAAPGTYTVTATITSPLYGTKVLTQSVTAAVDDRPTTIYGTGDLTILVYDETGTTLLYSLSGSQIWNGTTIPPGTYNFRINTSEIAYRSGYTSGFRKITYTIGSTTNCMPSQPYTFNYNMTTMGPQPNKSLSFSLAYTECIIEEVD